MSAVRSLLVAALLVLVVPSAAAAATRYASPTGIGPASTCSQVDPCNLEDAVEDPSVADGDEVVVTAGPYNETNPLVADDAITVHGGSGFFLPGLTFATPGMSALIVDDPGAVVSDLSVNQTAGITALDVRAGTVERVRVQTNGASACTLAASGTDFALLRDSTCWNTSAAGRAVGVSSSGTPLSGTIRNATAYATGAMGVGLDVEASGGGTAVIDARNVIASGGSTDVSASADATSIAAVALTSSNYLTVSPPDATTAITPPGSGANQIAEPLLVNPAAGQFDQLAGSPTIDAGAADSSIGVLDVNSDPRIQNGVPDIGADEFPDAVPPQTTITSGPTGPTSVGRPTFGFSSSEAPSTFICQFDSDNFRSCSSLYMAPDSLAQGEHTFRVLAFDVAANADPTPAERSFTVDKSISGANVSAKGKQRQKHRKIALKIKVRAGERVRVSGRGSVKAGKKRYPFRSRDARVEAGGKRTLTLTAKKPSASRRIRSALKHDEEVAAELTATFVDDLGNRATSGTVEVKLKGK